MLNLAINAELRSLLPTLKEAVMIVDENGKFVGSFTPISLMMPPPMSREEIQRIMNSTEKRLTTAELLASLEKS